MQNGESDSVIPSEESPSGSHFLFKVSIYKGL